MTAAVMASHSALARLVRRAVQEAAQAPQASQAAVAAETQGSVPQDTIIGALLSQLLQLCAAERGALLVSASALLQAQQVHMSQIHADTAVYRALVCHAMNAQEATAIPTAFQSMGARDQIIAGESLWLIFPLALGGLMDGLAAADQASTRSGEGTGALLIVGWTQCTDDGPAVRARRVLPLVADLAAAVVAALLLPARTGEQSNEQAHAGQRLSAADPTLTDWEQIFDAISDPVCVLTPDYHIVRANAAYSCLFGRAPGALAGHECFASGGGASGGGRDAPCPGCPLPQTIRTQRPSFLRQERLLPVVSGGPPEPRIVETWAYPIFDAHGEVARVVEILKDVTERERLRQATSLAEALREADRLKAELLGTVSHELRSPLASIKGYAETLLRHERRLPREERHEFLLAIREGADRLEELIGQLLEMSQLETGTVTLEREPVDMVRLARDTVAGVAQRTAEHAPDHFTFGVREAPGLGAATVIGDARRLREVLEQLLENAAKYSPDGGSISVTVGADDPERAAASAAGGRDGGAERSRQPQPPPVRRIEIRVSDAGSGIPPEQLDAVFQRFHRVDTRLTREIEGLGLGLAICKRIVELHGGTIWAESQPGTGSTFHVLLPAASTQATVPSAAMADERDVPDGQLAPAHDLDHPDQLPPIPLGARRSA
jgi:signal transduction histidine kinase